MALLKDPNNWRHNYNPIRGLSMQRIAGNLEQGEQGIYSELTWLYRFVEKRDAYIRATKRRRKSALQKLDWSIKISEAAEGDPALESMALAQQEALTQAYEKVCNVTEAMGWLSSAEFRGFAHLEKHYDLLGNVVRLEPVEQWYWGRKMPNLDWLYNPKADGNQVGWYVMKIDRADFVIREVEDPIDEVACVAFLRRNMGKKDWDATVETFGIPPVFVTMPQNSTQADQAFYQAMIEETIGNSRGVLPFGATVAGMKEGQGNLPFKDYLQDIKEEIVLAGTGGKLTMLNDPTGIGSGNSEIHQETFDDLAKAEAKEISETMQRDFDKLIISTRFPGQAVLAYFELSANEEQDTTEYITNVGSLAQHGYVTAPAEVAEKTGMDITYEKPQAPAPFGGGAPSSNGHARTSTSTSGSSTTITVPPLFAANRSTDPSDLIQSTRKLVAEALARDLKSLRSRISKIAQIQDPALRNSKLKELKAELPKMLKDLNADPATEKVFAGAFSAAYFNGRGA